MSFLDFKEDVYDELKKMSCLPHLDPALKLAAAQLEFLKPAVMTITIAPCPVGRPNALPPLLRRRRGFWDTSEGQDEPARAVDPTADQQS